MNTLLYKGYIIRSFYLGDQYQGRSIRGGGGGRGRPPFFLLTTKIFFLNLHIKIGLSWSWTPPPFHTSWDYVKNWNEIDKTKLIFKTEKEVIALIILALIYNLTNNSNKQLMQINRFLIWNYILGHSLLWWYQDFSENLAYIYLDFILPRTFIKIYFSFHITPSWWRSVWRR